MLQYKKVVAGLTTFILVISCYKFTNGCIVPKQFVNLRENEPPDTVLLSITNVHKSISLQAENGLEKNLFFHLHKENGSDTYTLKTNTTFDYEKNDVFKNGGGSDFRVSVVCGGVSNSITIHLENIVDLKPTFVQRQYQANISETSQVGDTVVQFSVKDDQETKEHLTYTTYSIEPYSGTFSPDESTTSIKLEKTVNYDKQHIYKFNLTAKTVFSFNDTLYYTNTVPVIVNILDYDNKPPKFTNKSYSIDIPENASLHSQWNISSKIPAFDQDRGIDQTIEFAMVGAFPETAFNISLADGEVIVTKPLDREKIDKYGIVIKAYQIDHPETKTDIANIDVTIIDINDNCPVMSQNETSVNIAENTPDGTVMYTVSASDKDSGENGIFQYELVDVSGAFDVDNQSGILSVKNSTILDREQRGSITIQVYAIETQTRELHKSENTTITINLMDENDNSPVFDKNEYRFTTNKNASLNFHLGQVQANDSDSGKNGEIEYNLYGDQTQIERFRINKSSGMIIVNSSLSNNYKPRYDFFVEARDKAEPFSIRRTTTVPVDINVQDVNMNEPKILEINDVDIKEDSLIGTLVTFIKAHDEDVTDVLHYQIQSGDTKNQFYINSTSGEITLSKNLDREDVSKYMLHIGVGDGLHNTRGILNVTVIDVNDNAPKFQKMSYIFHIAEENPAVKVGKVEANDTDTGNNSILTYSMTSIWGSNFTIEKRTGEVKTQGAIDRENPLVEQLGELTITVTATDTGTPKLSTDINMTVIVYDINDNVPHFQSPNLSFTIKEKAKPPFELYTAEAFDNDVGNNSAVTYYMKTGNSSIFNVLRNGTVVVSKRLDIDNGDLRSYVIEIEANNPAPYAIAGMKSEIQTVTVIVQDINDHSPFFGQNTYSFNVSENITIGTELTTGRILATDGDISSEFNTVTYWIEGLGSENFGINSTTGMMTVVRPLDYENEQKYNFKVFASDMHLSDGKHKIENISANISISVTDINDNTPLFTKELYTCAFYENKTKGDIHGCVVNASDHDLMNNRITYRIDQVYDIDMQYGNSCLSNCDFKINGTTGQISTNKLFDREKDSYLYVLRIEAVDSGNPPLSNSTRVMISIEDVNDNPPIFDDTNVTYIFDEWSQPENFHTAIAHDDDASVNSEVSYRMKSGNSFEFSVHENGTLTSKQELKINGVNNGIFVVEIEAYNTLAYIPSDLDNGLQTVNIILKDVNDNSPQFTEPSYSFNVMENETVGEQLNGVSRIEATDNDTTAEFNTINYWIAGPGSENFNIDSRSGNITVATDLDYETAETYNFYVYASDMHPSYGESQIKTASASVSIDVIDVNDQSPEFLNDIFYCSLKENTKVFVHSCNVSATDTEAGLDGNVTYRIIKGESLNSKTETFKERCLSYCGFAINRITGQIFSNQTFDKETDSDLYILTIEAVDSGNPPLSNHTRVMISIEDVNDNPPVFYDTNVTYIFDELSQPENFHTAIAKDADALLNEEIIYRMKSGDSSLFFVLENGTLTSKQKLQIKDDNNGSFVIEIEAFNTIAYSSDTIINGTQTVVVILRDVNDHSPNFTEPSYSFVVMENKTAGEQIDGKDRIMAIDNDASAEYNTINYWIDGPESEYFNIDSRSGYLTIARNLDYESIETFNFAVYASDMHPSYGKSTIKTASASVSISIIDVNDQTPDFANDIFYCSLKENTKLFMHSCNVSATDTEAGLNGEVMYRVIKGESLNSKVEEFKEPCSSFCGFAIDSDTGKIFSNRTFDRETDSDLYMLTIEAADGGNPTLSNHSKIMISIEDVNDNPPLFDDTNVKYIFDELSQPENFHTAIARDADEPLNGVVVYRMKSDDASVFSFLDNGTLTSKQMLQIKDDNNGIFVIEIEAFNTIAYSSNKIHNGTQTVVIIVRDVNDHSPNFTEPSYTFNVTENEKVGQQLYRIIAVDNDASAEYNTINYWIDGPESEYFNIDSRSGNLTVARNLDYESIEKFNFTVYASDMHPFYDEPAIKTVSARVLVYVMDVNDQTPEFSNDIFFCSLKENTKVFMHSCDVIANDTEAGPNGDVIYRIIKGESLNSKIEKFKESCSSYCGFAINKTTGHIFSNKTFDKETDSDLYILTIEAVDSGNPPLSSNTTVMISIEDVNDNPPVFDDTNVTYIFDELSQPDNFHTAIAHDRDSDTNGKIIYRLMSGDSVVFSLCDNGTLTSNKKLKMDDTQGGEFILKIEAYNTHTYSSRAITNGTQTLKIVLKDVNDHSPKFTQSVYTFFVMENSKTGSYINGIKRIRAMDNDTSIEFSSISYWIDGTGSEYFNIDNYTGELMLARELDYENKTLFNFEVYASDMHPLHGQTAIHNASANVVIHVTDFNDIRPQFSKDVFFCTLKENSKDVLLNCVVNATDGEVGANGEITLSISNAVEFTNGDSKPCSSNCGFAVNDVTGQVSSHKWFDREKDSSYYMLTIEAIDGGSPKLSSSARVMLSIEDENDNAPVFDETNITYIFDELLQPENFYSAEAHDADIGINSNIAYRVESGDVDIFVMHENDMLTTRKPILMENAVNGTITLKIEAYNTVPYSNNTLENGTQTLTILLKDVNDHYPVFENAPYSYNIWENIPVGNHISDIDRVSAVDGDVTEQFNTVRYWLDGDGNDGFIIDSSSGIISVAKPLDYENRTEYHLTVFASDDHPYHENGTILTPSSNVVIHVCDINDNAPHFEHEVYQCNLKENTSNGVVFCSVLATDDDSTSNNNMIIYNIILDGGTVPFQVNASSGNIFVAGSVDFDAGNTSYSFKVSAIDNGSPSLTGTATVMVTIENINDNDPVFHSTPYAFNVTENEPVGTVFGIINATDKDGDNLAFRLVNFTGKLGIDENGILTTKTVFDYEAITRPPIFNVGLNVSDGKHFVVTRVKVNIVNLNDNNPKFENDTYYSKLLENSTTGQLMKVKALDADELGNLNYSLLESSTSCSVFSISETSGIILYDNSRGCLDYETEPFISLLIEVNDGGVNSRSSRAVVDVELLDADDMAPYFLQHNYNASVKENEPVGTEIITVYANDKDAANKYLVFDVVNSDGNFSFYGNKLITERELDFEMNREYIVNVSVSDGVHLTYDVINVNVVDVNDNAPQFKPFNQTFAIPQNAAEDTTVADINVTDEDTSGGFTFYITGGRDDFKINELTGVISVARKDHFIVNSIYNITIHSVDYGSPPRSNTSWIFISIDTSNHFSPVFDGLPYTKDVHENTDFVVSVYNVSATDKDYGKNGKIIYSIESGDEGKFYIDEDSGQIFLNSSLDYETRQYQPYKIIVQATDKGDNPRSATATVTVNVIDVNEPPIFQNNHLELCVNLPISKDSIVGVTKAIDNDSSKDNYNKINYTIVDGNLRGLFQIDRHGNIKTTRNINTTLPGIILTIAATDGKGLNDTATVSIAVIESSGDGSQPSVILVNVNENITGTYIIADVNTTEGSSVSYKIVNSSLPGMFHIDSTTGLITASMPLDRERMSTVSLEIEVDRMGGHTNGSKCNSQVVINVVDINDNRPYFTSSYYEGYINESVSPGDEPTCIVRLEAHDQDVSSRLMFSLTSDDSNGLFEIGFSNLSYACIVLGGYVDFESIPAEFDGWYHMKIMVSDGKYNDTASVDVKIFDVNDNDPYFNASEYYFSIVENHPPRTPLTIQAYDRDELDSGKLTFKITGDEASSFSLRQFEDTVQLILPSRLDRETNSSYIFTLLVFDTAGHQNSTVVNITIEDANDNAPKFDNSTYTFTVPEGNKSLELNEFIHAYDADIGENALITFSIVGNKLRDTFSLNNTKDSDIVSFMVTKALDRDHASTILQTGEAIYSVTVQAQDHGKPPQTTTTQVVVKVTDINDCTPSFDKLQYNASVIEGSPAGFSVFSVKAKDCDFFPENKNISYSLSGTDKDSFKINSEGGIYLNSTITIKDAMKPYQFVVTASDGLNKNTTTVTITVTDVNDHDPRFKKDLYHFSTPENDYSREPYKAVVGAVSATDKDFGRNGEISYRIISSDMLSYFNLSENGTINVIGKLNRDSCLTNVLSFTVAATDNGDQQRTGYAEVVVHVTDVNDNSPNFTMSAYEGTVKENSVYGTSVIINPSIQARDIDEGVNGTEGIYYSLEGPGSGTAAFIINETTGMVYVNNGSLLNRENYETYHLKIIAADRLGHGNTDNVNLTITLTDVNDEPPVFEHDSYNFNVREDANVSSEVGSVKAYDMDENGNTSIRYSIESGGHGRFYIDKSSGNIYIGGGLDRETRAVYTLHVSAFDNIHEDITKVVINIDDVNDNCPVFETTDITYHVEEDRSFDHPLPLINLTATDKDAGENGHITFFTNDTGSVNVSVFPSGEIIRHQKFDREKRSNYEFNVYAKDNGSTPCIAKAKVTIYVLDINDNKPTFYDEEGLVISSINTSMIEKAPVHSPIVYPDVWDDDIGNNGTITFNLTSVPALVAKYFAINFETGVVSISKPINSMELEHENLTVNGVLLLAIIASDKGRPSLSTTIPLRIVVEKINDDSPDFEKHLYNFQISENIPNGSFVGRVRASENATFSTLKYSIFSDAIATSYFFVNPFNGNITTIAPLDREKQGVFTFTVQVVDGRTPERTAFTMVSVSLSDENDNTPVFEKRNYFFAIVENSEDVPEMLIRAVDSDYGNNGSIVYSVHDIDGCSNCFILNEDNGTLALNRTLDRETENEIHLTINASDKGIPPRSAEVNVTINILDVNDNRPVFQMLPYQCSISENKPFGETLINVTATDADSGLNGTVVFALEDTYGSFEINSLDGTITTTGSLDYETLSEYLLTVIAKDLGTPIQMSSRINVSVTVIDQFDETISFNETMYMVNISTESPVDTHVTQVSTGIENVTYSITDGNHINAFRINTTTGEIRMNAVINDPGSYILSIKAAFDVHPDYSASTQVFILVYGNEASKFNRSYTVSVMENLNTSHGVLLFDVNTTSEISGQFVRYQLVETIPKGNFSVDTLTGKVYCLQSLDRETHSKYILHILAETSLSNRNKRSFGDSPGEIIVVVNVDDENDNYPIFISANPIYVSPGIQKGDQISTISVTDLDDGNGKAIRFAVAQENNQTFSIDHTTGDLYSQDRLLHRENYTVTITATDNYGTGLQTKKQFQIIVLPPNNRMIFTIPISLHEYKLKHETLLKNLSNILGITISVEKAQGHITDNIVNPLPQTYLYFYGINQTTKEVLPNEIIQRIVKGKATEITKLFKNDTFGIMVVPVYHNYKFSEAEIALLTLAVVILISGIFAIVITQLLWKSKDVEIEEMNTQDRLKMFELESMRSASIRSLRGSALGVVNPAFQETKLDENSNAQAEGTSLKQVVQYESQELTMEFINESLEHPLRNECQNDDAAKLSIGDSGTSTISGDSNNGSVAGGEEHVHVESSEENSLEIENLQFAVDDLGQKRNVKQEVPSSEVKVDLQDEHLTSSLYDYDRNTRRLTFSNETGDSDDTLNEKGDAETNNGSDFKTDSLSDEANSFLTLKPSEQNDNIKHNEIQHNEEQLIESNDLTEDEIDGGDDNTSISATTYL